MRPEVGIMYTYAIYIHGPGPVVAIDFFFCVYPVFPETLSTHYLFYFSFFLFGVYSHDFVGVLFYPFSGDVETVVIFVELSLNKYCR